MENKGLQIPPIVPVVPTQPTHKPFAVNKSLGRLFHGMEEFGHRAVIILPIL
jgi:hypothetical protein